MKIAMRTFRSTRALNISSFADNIRKAMNEDVKDHYIDKFSAITKPWKSDIPFGASVTVKLDSISLYIFPTGADKMKFIWVDLGTKRHDIPARGSWLYIPKAKYTKYTQPIAKYGSVGGYLTGRASGGFSKRAMVTHPGIEPRLFSQDIALNESNKRVFNNAIRRAIRRTLTEG